MTVWGILLVVAVAGALGGVVAALLSEDKGFVLPTKVAGTNGGVIRPGFVGLILIGAAAAALSFALYGPLSDSTVVGGPDPEPGDTANDDHGITLAALGGAVLVGAGGSKWLSSQVDKAVLQRAAAAAARGGTNVENAEEIASAKPTRALYVAQNL